MFVLKDVQRQCGTQRQSQHLFIVYPGSSGAEMADVSARVEFATKTTTVETKVTSAAQFVEVMFRKINSRVAQGPRQNSP